MFKLPSGEVWRPKSTQEHAEEILARWNEILRQHNILNSDGTPAVVNQNYANIGWLLCLALGDKLSEKDQEIDIAINSYDISSCDDEQLRALMPVIGEMLRDARPSSVVVTIAADDGNALVIPAGSYAEYNNLKYETQIQYTIAAGTSLQIGLVANQTGANYLPADSLQLFTDPDGNEFEFLKSFTQPAVGMMGRAEETLDEYRARILKGLPAAGSDEALKAAIEDLAGISKCSVYYNADPTQPLQLEGGVILQPRCLYIVVSGSSDRLAETIAENTAKKTQGAIADTWTSTSGQTFDIYYNNFTLQKIEILVETFPETSITQETRERIANDIIVQSASWNIGQEITDSMLCDIFRTADYIKVVSCGIRAQGEVQYKKYFKLNADSFANITPNDITVQVVST